MPMPSNPDIPDKLDQLAEQVDRARAALDEEHEGRFRDAVSLITGYAQQLTNLAAS